ncbi:fruit bromelain-like isoform X2 [Ananas comosus]|uniref:Fruit bromelain-like isoform X1 n=1 Tax=Ananas comosus TaxID=4615 RepID=A0A6P5F0R8_ANACO|nr:fruit bromelain-like isoform X1 [Ananas comosus]XP_020089328.1 fruit bromelain-like isoform X2 [Ananas comosus]
MASKFQILFLFLFLSVMWASSLASRGEADDSMMKRFEEWMADFGRVYSDDAEKMRRFEIFKDNVNRIEAFNRRGGNSYTLGINQFADMTNNEIVAQHVGLSLPLNMTNLEPSVSFEDVNMSAIPQSIDWRDYGAVTPVKNQGSCGSCWAFSSIATVEGIYKIKTGQLISLSEQEVLDCTVSNGCTSGWVHKAYEFIIANKGVTAQANYPYVGYKGTCAANSKPNAAYITGYQQVQPSYNERAIMYAVANQPTVIAIDASSYYFNHYNGGIFKGPCGTNIFHAVTVVGYGQDSSTGDKYWIIKNSWGNTWGENGYVRMLRDTAYPGLCGLASYGIYPTLVSSQRTTEPSDMGSDDRVSSM